METWWASMISTPTSPSKADHQGEVTDAYLLIDEDVGPS
jgi:hypothetical protein